LSNIDGGQNTTPVTYDSSISDGHRALPITFQFLKVTDCASKRRHLLNIKGDGLWLLLVTLELETSRVLFFLFPAASWSTARIWQPF
jgi:hypothetical protein